MNYAEKLSGRESALIIGIAGKKGFTPNYKNSFENNVNEALEFILETMSPRYSTLCAIPKIGEIVLDRDEDRTLCISEEKEADTTGYGISLDTGSVVRYYFPKF